MEQDAKPRSRGENWSGKKPGDSCPHNDGGVLEEKACANPRRIIIVCSVNDEHFKWAT